MVDRIVVVGGGVAAQRCAMALRREGFAGAVAMISAEDQAPYDRTLLSKDLLASEELADLVPLAASDDYAEAGIDLRLGVRAAGLDAARRRVALSDGDELSYDRLVVATGGRPVLPPALDAPGVLTLRGVADLPALRDALARARHVVVIGAGFIGAEVASAAVARHAPVTLVEAAGGPLAPVLGEEVAGRLAELHRAAGVELACDAPVLGVEQDRGALRVALADGRVLTADAVLVGVGMSPDVDWLAGSGIELDDGIVTGPACETSAPDVFAAGDCARWLHRRYGEHVRVEHWDTAARHGEAAAAGALGSEEPFTPLPYFWSDQHETKLQWVGHAPAWDEVEIEDDDEPGFVARYHCDGALAGVLTAGRPRACAAARRELQTGTPEEALIR